MMKQLEELRRGLVSGFLQDAADAGPAGRSSFTENTVPRIPESGRPDPSESSTAGEPLQKIERPWERKSPGPENRAGGVYSRETQSRIDQDDDDEPEPDLESIDTRDVRSSVGTGIDPEGSVRETAGRTATAVADPAGASPDDLLGKLVALVRKKKLALSSALEKAVSWKLEGDTLRILFDSSFSASFVRQDIAEVTEKARELLARPVKVTAEVRESDTQGQDAGTDEQVELVKRVFRGQVVKGE
jgi:hypothetical protein